jgi:hypothetical protein
MSKALAEVYLVEGADATGKSSFVFNRIRDLNELGEPLPRVIHNDASDHRLPGSLYRHYRAQILDAFEFRERGVTTFIDRTFLSELVYGRLYRGRARITEMQARRLQSMAYRHGVILLGMTAADSVREVRILDRGESWDSTQPAVASLYNQWFHENRRHWNIADSSSALFLD